MHVMRRCIINKIKHLGFYVAMLIIICTIFRPFIPRLAAGLARGVGVCLMTNALNLVICCTDKDFLTGWVGKKFVRARRDVITLTNKIRKIESRPL